MKKIKNNLILLFFTIFFSGLCILLFYQINESYSMEMKKKPKFEYANIFDDDSGVVILCYHRILKNTPVTKTMATISDNSQLHEYNVWLDDFEKQMNFFKKNSIPILSVEQLTEKISNKSITGKAVVITFDDVDKTVIENAYPIMKNLSIPFAQFVITGRTGEMVNGVKMMNWDDIINISKDPLVTTGLHTNDLHYQKNNVPILSTNVEKKTVIADFDKSQNQMMKYLRKKGEYFAYPYGAQNNYLDSYMEKNDMKGIFTLSPGVVTNSTKLNSIPRLIVNKDSWERIQRWVIN